MVGGAVGGFFALKIVCGLALLTTSARWLTAEQFLVFSQLFQFLALISTISAGGVQNGVIREAAAAHDDHAAVVRISSAALLVWAAACVLLATVTILARAPLSQLFVGTHLVAGIIPWLTALALLGGAGQIFCAMLTGRGAAAWSLGAQSLGLLAGTAGCLALLWRGQADIAVLAFAAGPILTALIAGAQARTWLGRTDISAVLPEAQRLLAYSGVFVTTAAIMPAALFVLRAEYREAYGVVALSYWLVANRISDVTSQLLGMFMAQAFLPAITAARSSAQSKRLVRNFLLIGAAMMTVPLLAFVAAPEFWISIVLSAKFLPAIPFIVSYLAGDVARAATSLATNSALARRRLVVVVAVEGAWAMALTAAVLGLMALGIAAAPYIGYLIATVSVAAGSLLAMRRWMGHEFVRGE